MADKIPQFRRKTSSGYQILQEGNPFQVPDNKIQENITVTPSNERQTLYAELPYNGVHEILVKSVTEADSALRKENIAQGITIFGITGEYGGGGSDLYDGDVTLTTNPQTFNPEGHDGFSSIKVNANISAQGTTSSPYVIPVNESKDNNYVTIPKPSSSIGMSQAVVKLHSDLEQYIKKNTKILGITGTYEGSSSVLGAKTVDPSTSSTTYNASSDSLDGYSSFTVNAIQTETKSTDPSTSQQIVTPSTGKYLTSVTVSAIQTETKSVTPSTSPQIVTPSTGKYLTNVTVAGDSDLVASNIKKDVEIFGVTGNYEGTSPVIQPVTGVTLYANTSRIDKAAGTDGMDYTTFTLDSSLRNIIKKGETILGVTGAYEGGLGTEEIYNDGKFFQGFNGMSVHNLYYEAGSSSFQAYNGGPSSSAYSGKGYIYITPAINLSGYTRLCVDGGYSVVTSPYPQYAVVSNPSSPSGNFVTITGDSHFDIPASMTTGYIYFKIENMSIHTSKSFWVTRIWLQ